MAIVKMSKFNLIFNSTDRIHLLETLQKFKYIHILDLHDNKLLNSMDLAGVHVNDTLVSIDEDIRKVTYSINILQKFDTRKKGLHRLKEGVQTYNLDDLEKQIQTIGFINSYERIRNHVSEKEKIKEKVKRVNEKINELRPWLPLDVPIKWLSSLEQCLVNIGTIPKKLKTSLEQELTQTELSYYGVISEDHQYTYIMTITHQNEADDIQKIIKNNGFSKIDLDYVGKPDEEISLLTDEKNSLQSELHAVKEKLKVMSGQLCELELVYDYLVMKKTRISASKKLLGTERFNVMEGYIPTQLVNKFQKIVEKQLADQVYLHIEEAIEDDPNVPILLDNSKFFRAFESVTEMYALPKYNEIDPTPLFSIFYSLFFGMMIGDAGYGLLMFAGTFTVLRLLKLSSKQRSFIRFFYYLSFSTILWGIVYGSFFGDMVSLPALINTTEQYNLLLILSIIFGGLHIFFALGIQGYMNIKKGKLLDALFDVGFWYMALCGGIVFLLALFLPIAQSYKNIGFIIMIIGMVGILLTGGRHNQGIGGKIAGGLYSLYGISGYVADFVSYSRLMALGLASAFIAYAINMMVGMLFNLGVIGIILGMVVFVVGQGFNMFLGILSSYVHTLRLTYVEFFGKFYEGGGKAFQIFGSQSKYINIK